MSALEDDMNDLSLAYSYFAKSFIMYSHFEQTYVVPSGVLLYVNLFLSLHFSQYISNMLLLFF